MVVARNTVMNHLDIAAGHAQMLVALVTAHNVEALAADQVAAAAILAREEAMVDVIELLFGLVLALPTQDVTRLPCSARPASVRFRTVGVGAAKNARGRAPLVAKDTIAFGYRAGYRGIRRNDLTASGAFQSRVIHGRLGLLLGSALLLLPPHD